MNTLFGCSVAIVMLSVVVSGWGPVTHQSLTFVESEYSFATDYSFQLGTYSPDAFTSFTFAFHNLDYAASQLQYAILYNSTDPDFDPIAWSLGFGAHLANDLVGFHPGGWLRSVSFSTVFLSVDTYNYLKTPQLDYRYFAPAVDKVAKFASAASQYYATMHPDFTPVSVVAVKTACNLYDQYSKAFLVNVTSNTDYQNLLIAGDPYNPADWTECESHLTMQMECCKQVAAFWINNTLLHVGPKELQAMTNQFADDLYDSGVCAPLA